VHSVSDVMPVPDASRPVAEWPEHGLEAVLHCPVCSSPRRRLAYEKVRDRVFRCAPGEWSLYECSECHSGYLDPRPTEDTIHLAYSRYYTHGSVAEAPERTGIARLRRWLRDAYLSAAYAERPPGLDPRPLARLGMSFFGTTKLGLDRLARHLPRARPGGHLLDVGCGNGRFLTLAKQLGWTVSGIDPDRAAVEAATNAGLDVALGRLPGCPFPDGSFDVVTLSHSIEHSHSPLRLLEDARRVLRPGGILWVSTPNFAGLCSSRFGSDWLAMDPPRQLLLFTPTSLTRAVRASGFVSERFHRTLLTDFPTSLALSKGLDPWAHVDLDTLKVRGKLPFSWSERLTGAGFQFAMMARGLGDELILTARKQLR
jgi:SAM-dependent methyltransferase